MPKVLVITVTYNAMRWVDRCLGSVRASSLPLDAVVIDNGSTDGTPEHVESVFPWVTLVRSGENLGFGAANNIGLRMAVEQGYDYVYLLNQDAWLEEDTVAGLIACGDGFGILSPMQMDADGNLDRRFAAKCSRFLKKGTAPVVEVPFVMAAHWLVSRDALLAVGGFSPAFRQYGEDDNYLDRLHYWGFKAGVARGVKAVHDRSRRPESKEWRMRMKAVGSVVRLSSPCRKLWFRKVLEPLMLVGASVKNFSSIPLKAVGPFVKRYDELSRIREESKHKSAFLNG